jgi:hypothetical protein
VNQQQSDDLMPHERPRAPAVRPTPPLQRVAVVPLVEHRACGTSFPRTEACPECGKRLLEG